MVTPAGTPAGQPVVGNQWTELDGVWPDPAPTVSVVVAHFEQQSQLDRTLLALDRQTHPRALLDVIVVDDGSRIPPTVPSNVRLVRQEDRGFRLSAARNAGAAIAVGDVLCFLDADTSPEPGFVREITRLPALVPDAVTVGRRNHADLAGVAAHDPIEIVGPAHRLPSPDWLTLAYERSANLLESDHRSYRHLIGAVLACSAPFFAEVGGFDESFDSYGGEDWEWGYRAWLAGAVLAHVPEAVAWHDGPDWSGRSGGDDAGRRQKNRETLTLRHAIPGTGSRGRGLRSAHADVVVEVRSASSAAALFVCVDSILESLPQCVVVVPAGWGGAFADDPRVLEHLDPAAHPLARVVVSLSEPMRVDPGRFRSAVEAVGAGAGEAADVLVRPPSSDATVEIRSTRALRRRARWQRDDLFPTASERADWVTPPGAEPDLEAYLGGWG